MEGKIDPSQQKVQDCNLKFPAYLLPIVGAKVIMGAAWLSTLGAHIMDYRSLTLQFFCEGQFATLNGEKEKMPQQTTVHQLNRLSSIKYISECYQLTVAEMADNLEEIKIGSTDVDKVEIVIKFTDEMLESLRQLLSKYQGVFETPKALPPSRLCDHRIQLQPNSGPIKVRPYRYPHSQKTEIEKMVNQMLMDGIIEPSNSPYSSPVILVKKKDGT